MATLADITYERAKSDVTAPGTGAKVVTPDDDDPIWEGEVARQILVFGEGAITCRGADGVDFTLTYTSDMGYPQAIPVLVSHVLNTNTNVNTIVAIR